LKNKNIILMGNGKLDGEVYRTCTFLKQVGYTSVFVFQGGVTNWMLSSYATVGNVTRAFDDIRLTPSELFIESREAENLIYLDPSRDDMFKYFPSASILTTVSSEKIKISLEAVKAKELLGLILIGARSLTIEQIRSLQQAALPRRLIVYSGSANDYQSFLNQQKKTWIAQVNGPKKLGCGL
jgi:predicted Zn-dependent peptidase